MSGRSLASRLGLEALARPAVQQPLSRPVPADEQFAARKGAAKLAVRTLRRRLQLRWSGQQPLRKARFEPGWRRVLWVHEGMPQIGDALMDLAPRSLLAERGFEVDLIAPPHLATLFAGDPWLRRVMPSDAPVHAGDYDAALLLSDDRRSLRLKRTRLPQLPWLSLQGLYNGPDFHRARFATQRLADLLELDLGADEFARHAAQKLGSDAQAAAWAAEACPWNGGIALALGGVWADRTYTRWSELMACLRAQGLRRWILVGGDNGRALADRLVAELPAGDEVIDVVGRTTLRQVHALLGRSRAAVCADGGLMHLALTTPAAVVGLFNRSIAPEWRLPLGGRCIGLASASPLVDDVAPAEIAAAVLRLLDQP